jgi:hypothetical protein
MAWEDDLNLDYGDRGVPRGLCAEEYEAKLER